MAKAMRMDRTQSESVGLDRVTFSQALDRAWPQST